MTKKNELVATRIPRNTLRVLQLAVVLEETTMQELLRPIVEKYAKELAAEPEMKAMLEQVEKHKERKTGVRKLPSRAGRASKARTKQR